MISPSEDSSPKKSGSLYRPSSKVLDVRREADEKAVKAALTPSSSSRPAVSSVMEIALMDGGSWIGDDGIGDGGLIGSAYFWYFIPLYMFRP